MLSLSHPHPQLTVRVGLPASVPLTAREAAVPVSASAVPGTSASVETSASVPTTAAKAVPSLPKTDCVVTCGAYYTIVDLYCCLKRTN